MSYWIRIYCSKLNIFVFKDVNQLANNNASSDSIVPIEELISIDDKNGNMLSWFFGYKKVNFIEMSCKQKDMINKLSSIFVIASKNDIFAKDIEDVVPNCKDNELCNTCPDNQVKETNVIKRRRYR